MPTDGGTGPIVESHYVYALEILALIANVEYVTGSKPAGAKVSMGGNDVARAGIARLQADELVGKIGPAVEAYDPEAGNALIQEF